MECAPAPREENTDVASMTRMVTATVASTESRYYGDERSHLIARATAFQNCIRKMQGDVEVLT